jgi:hypothetical protein
MHTCGSIATAVVEAISDAERDHLETRNITERLRQRKLRRLEQMVVAAATRDAKRGVAYE